MIKAIRRFVFSRASLYCFAAVIGYWLADVRMAQAVNLGDPCHCCSGWTAAFLGNGTGTWAYRCTFIPGWPAPDGCTTFTTSQGRFEFCPGGWTFDAYVMGMDQNTFCIQRMAWALIAGNPNATNYCPGIQVPDNPGPYQECCCTYCQDPWYNPAQCPHSQQECNGGGCTGGCVWQYTAGQWVSLQSDCAGGGNCNCPQPIGCQVDGAVVQIACGATAPNYGTDLCTTPPCQNQGGDADQDGCCDNVDADSSDPAVCDPPSGCETDNDDDGCCDDVDLDPSDPEVCSICDNRGGDEDEDECCDDVDSDSSDPEVCQECNGKCRWERVDTESMWRLTSSGCPVNDEEPEDDEDTPNPDPDPAYKCPMPDDSGVELVKYTDCDCSVDCECEPFFRSFWTRWKQETEDYWPGVTANVGNAQSSFAVNIPKPGGALTVTVYTNPAMWGGAGAAAAQAATLVRTWCVLLLFVSVSLAFFRDLQSF